MTRCEHVEQVAVYVLGALDDDERAAYEKHLVSCDDCRREYDELADMPALLDLAASVPAARPPPGGEERLVASLRRESASRRTSAILIAVGAALAGAAAAAALILGLGIGASDTSAAPTIALVPASSGVAAGAWATAKLHDRAAGTIVDFEAGNLPRSTADDRYVVLVREGGKTVAQAEFTVNANGWAQVAMESGQHVDPRAEFEVRRVAPGEPVVLRSDV